MYLLVELRYVNRAYLFFFFFFFSSVKYLSISTIGRKKHIWTFCIVSCLKGQSFLIFPLKWLLKYIIQFEACLEIGLNVLYSATVLELESDQL